MPGNFSGNPYAWKVHTAFQFGYSGFGIFYRKLPDIPTGYDSNGYKEPK